MQILRIFIFTCILALLTFGCATTGPTYSDMKGTLENLNVEMSRIYIYRVTTLAAALQPAIYVNEENVGNSVPQGFIYLDRPPGNYVIKTSTEVKRTLSVNLDSGETCFVRLNASFGFFVGHIYPELVEKNVGESEIKKCHYLGTSNNK